MIDRREFLGLGCAAIALWPLGAEAAPRPPCAHPLCRHHRPEGGGSCAMPRMGEVVEPLAAEILTRTMELP